MFESPSRIVLGIVVACVLLTALVLLRSGGEDKEAAPRPGSMTSQLANKPRPNQVARSDTFSHDSGGGFGSDTIARPRDLPSSNMPPPRPGAGNTADSQPGDAHEARDLAPAVSASGRNLAAEPVPPAPPGSGVLAGGGPGAIDPSALASIPSAPQDASLAASFNGSGNTLGSTAPLMEENVVYDLDEGAYFPPDARFAYGDAGTVQNNAGTIAFWLKPNWDGGDPRNASLVQYRTDNWSNRMQIFKNGRYLRYLFTDDTGSETNLGIDMVLENWHAGDWHYLAVTWGDSLISMYLDGRQRQQGTYAGNLDVPSGTALYVGSDYPGGNPGADATLQDFVVVDRALDATEVSDKYAQGRSSGKS